MSVLPAMVEEYGHLSAPWHCVCRRRDWSTRYTKYVVHRPTCCEESAPQLYAKTLPIPHASQSSSSLGILLLTS